MTIDKSKDKLKNNKKTTESENKVEKNKKTNILLAKDKKIQALEKDKKELNEKILKLLADMQNARNMFIKDKDQAVIKIKEKISEDLINPIECLYLAINNTKKDEIKKNESLKALYDGIIITKNEFLKSLEKHEITRLYPKIGETFDYKMHEAISQVESEEKDGTIIGVAQAGYKINDKIFKSAKVIVSKKK